MMRSMTVDPMASTRRIIEATQPNPVFDPMKSTKRLMEATQPKPLFDPMASSRRLMESWQAQKNFDPLTKYQRILGQFSNIAGHPAGTSQTETPTASVLTPDSALPTMPSASMVVALIGIAWTCAWMMANGADINALGGLFIDALGLALYLNEER